MKLQRRCFFWVFSQSGKHPLEDEEKVRITPLERFCQMWLSTKYEEQIHNNLVGGPVFVKCPFVLGQSKGHLWGY
jgi:hypothetical protein